ncbi:hypothetical protein STTU_4281 [Streptomyces sp. Tu6071]|nr:hypothetical protein STTU_4281 [Streptomyces sp. Tu6071]
MPGISLRAARRSRRGVAARGVRVLSGEPARSRMRRGQESAMYRPGHADSARRRPLAARKRGPGIPAGGPAFQGTNTPGFPRPRPRTRSPPRLGSGARAGIFDSARPPGPPVTRVRARAGHDGAGARTRPAPRRAEGRGAPRWSGRTEIPLRMRDTAIREKDERSRGS